MKKKLSILILLQVFCFLVFSIEIKVNVVDAEIEIPLEGVTISVSQIQDTWFTDEMGDAVITIEDSIFTAAGDSLTLSAYLPGYATKKIRINSKTQELTINLSIEDVFEGKELVVEQQAYQKTDAESGISVVITRDQFDNTAQIGSIPDVMTAVKTLPGVTYMGSFSQQPSIRGAYPYEMACVMDGAYVYSPFHWNGGVSIFDPMFIKSVKLSHGIFSARNGHATAGLLDITTAEPEDETIKFNASVSDILTDGVFQIPFTKNMGFVGGYRVSYYDTIPWFYDVTGITKFVLKQSAEEGDEIPNFRLSDVLRMPNMQDFYGKFYFNPTDRFHLAVNEFFAMEGIGLHIKVEDTDTVDPLKDYYISHVFMDLDWKNIFSFGSLSLQILPIDNLQINLSGNYNNYNNKRTMVFDDRVEYEGEEKYYISEDERYDEDGIYIPTDDPDYKLIYVKNKNITDITFEDSYLINLMQGKVSADYFLGNDNILSVGFEEFYKTKSAKGILNFEYHYYYESELLEEPRKEDIEWDWLFRNYTGNRILNSVGFATWEFGNTNSKLQGEAGFRFEHYYIYNKQNGKKLNYSAVPTFNPRVSVRYKPERQENLINNLTFSSGVGLFSQLSDSLIDYTYLYKMIGTLKPDQNLFTIAGFQFDFLGDYTFQFETYYKYYLNRYYAVGQQNGGSLWQEIINLIDDDGERISYENKAFTDGIGHVFGFDTMLQKKTGRYFDGYLTYSFIFARYLNPYKPKNHVTTDTGDPLGEWYYPYFHRFHTFNAVLNYRPKNGMVFTLNGSIVSGVPVSEDDIFNKYADQNIKRTSISFPINLRIAKSDYFKITKMQYEWYFGVENILGFLNRNSIFGAINYMSNNLEKENLYIYTERLANFDVGLPVISLGLRIAM